jgi:hypothetical protein
MSVMIIVQVEWLRSVFEQGVLAVPASHTQDAEPNEWMVDELTVEAVLHLSFPHHIVSALPTGRSLDTGGDYGVAPPGRDMQWRQGGGCGYRTKYGGHFG